MFTRIFQYCSALTFLLALAVIYQNVVEPLTRPPDVGVIAMAVSTDITVSNLVDDLFPDTSWQRGVCKQLQTSGGMLLFQNWKQVSKDQWKLWPVTVVIGRGLSGVGNDAPVIIEADEGAEIKFAQSLDVMSGGAPPIQRGRIIGSVKIRRDDVDDPSRRLKIETANVGIDNRKIWTTEKISMNVGDATCLGSDLTIHFAAPATVRNSAGDASELLDRMELIYLDRFSLPVKSDSKTEADALVSLHCGGRVEYDFALDQLLLSKEVSLVHQRTGQPADRFQCDWLQLDLNNPANQEISRSHPLAWLTGITAIGSPASARLPSYDAELSADRIDFNAAAGLVRAMGSRGVEVRRGAISGRFAQLIYRFDPEFPEAALSVEAPGAGRLQIADASMPLRKATWTQGFRFWPIEKSITRKIDSDVQLTIEGDVYAQLSDGGEFRAKSIAGVLAAVTETHNGKPERTFVPDRFDISGDVRIDTTAIAAETHRMLLFFVNDRGTQADVVGNQPRSSPLRQWVNQPAEGVSKDPVARARPVIRGDLVTAELLRNASGLNARKLSVTGSVEVEHQLMAGDKPLLAKLSGQSLQMIDGGGEDVLQLNSGVDSPAKFVLGDGFFIGPQIQIRPSDNYIWINDAGEFQIPTAALPSSLSDSRQSEKQGGPSATHVAPDLIWKRPPHCRWQGEMIFDGQTAVLSDGVVITGALINDQQDWEFDMSGDRLQVDLARSVQVKDVASMKQAQVERVALMQSAQRPILVQAIRRAGDGVQEARHLLHAQEIVLTPDDGGSLVGTGPGWYRGWSLASAMGDLRSGRSDSRDVDRRDREPPLTGIHLIFKEAMKAEMAARNLQFLRGVRVGVRGVRDWKEAFDAQTMNAISQGDATLDCDRLRFTIDPRYRHSTIQQASSSTPWEMEAESGVVFRTRGERGLLEGTASRASYSSSKDLFTVHGAPNRPAIFRQTLPDGSAGPEGAVRTMSIRPKSMFIENMVLERLNIAAPPGNSGRN